MTILMPEELNTFPNPNHITYTTFKSGNWIVYCSCQVTPIDLTNSLLQAEKLALEHREGGNYELE